MSWFSGLAGKAESLLDKMDQAAAVSLQGAGLTTSPQRNTNPPNIQSRLAYEPTAQLPEADRSTKVAQQLIGSSSGAKLVAKPASTKPTPSLKSANTASTVPTEQPKPHSSFTPSRTNDPTPSDESLFEFLNSPSKQPGQSGSRRVKHTTAKVPHTRSRPPPTPLSPVKVQPSVVAASEERPPQTSAELKETQIRKEESILEETDAPPSASHDVPWHQEVAQEDNTRKDDSGQGKLEDSSDSTTTPQMLEHSQLVTLQQRVSNLELENKLLKREVASLNDELGVMMGRVRDAGESVAQYEREISALRDHTSQSDHMIRQMRSQEEDLQAALEARDSQIEILRRRLSEADKAAEEMKQHISSSTKEKERLLQDANLSSDIHNHALDSLKAQLEQTEMLLQREREAASTMKVEFTERESRLQSEQLQLSEALSTQQRQLAIQQAKATEYQTALQSAHRELQLLTKDHEDYKQRAAGILQAKERLITSLQSGGGGGDREGKAAWEAQVEEVRLEREHLQAQLQSTHQQLENIRADMQELEDHHSREVDQLLEQVHVSEGVLSEERHAHMATQAELSRVSRELEESREDTGRERASQAMLLKEKENELQSLRTKLSSAAPGRAELESRLHELTESLIQKQTTLEALSSEKSSLNVQLQRMKNELSEAKRIYPNKTSLQTVVNGLESAESDSASRVRSVSPILSSSDSKGHLHNVRRAVNTVDRVSIHLGVFLRRYPYARLFAILYMVLLHIWVMVVLLTYTPEVHNSL